MATITKRVGVKGTTYHAKVRITGHEAAIREGRRFTGSNSEHHTLAELIDRYMSDVMTGKRA